jgi:hypothetical protein
MAFRNIGVYRDSETIRYHLGHFKKHTPNEWAYYDDLGHFLNSGHPINFGVIHIPYPFDTASCAEKLSKLRNHCDHVFLVGCELHQSIADFIKDNDFNDVSYFICGKLNFELQHATVGQYMDWFETSRYFYRDYLPEILSRLKTGEKERYFDILLGRKKKHRDAVYNFASKSLRDGQYEMTYFNDHHNPDFNDAAKWFWESEGLQCMKSPEWTVEMVTYFGHRMSLSQVIPITVYNKTYYSVIAETNYENGYSFFTEKTAKPIIAKRLFIMFAGQHYLRNLRSMGFKTFDGIIDESYDEIADESTRWEMATTQLKWLTTQDPSIILEKIKPIVDHNFKVMMEHPWLTDYTDNMEMIMSSVLDRIQL